MKIKVASLIAAINAATKTEAAEIQKYNEARSKFDDQRVTEWKELVLPRWSELATLIRDRIRRKQPITRGEINAVFRGLDGVHFKDGHNGSDIVCWADHGSTMFDLDGQSYRGRPVPDRQLPALKKFLESVEDETVSPTALKSLGFEKLEWLFRKATT